MMRCFVPCWFLFCFSVVFLLCMYCCAVLQLIVLLPQNFFSILLFCHCHSIFLKKNYSNCPTKIIGLSRSPFCSVFLYACVMAHESLTGYEGGGLHGSYRNAAHSGKSFSAQGTMDFGSGSYSGLGSRLWMAQWKRKHIYLICVCVLLPTILTNDISVQ